MRIGITTDIHENLTTLKKVLQLASRAKCDELACLGDITGFDRRFYRYNNSRSASGCVRLIKEHFKWIVAGNHDLFSAERTPSYNDGFEFPPDWFRMNFSERKLLADGRVWCYEGDEPTDLTDNDIDFLKLLPEFILFSDSGIKSLLSHYLYPDLTGSTTHYAEKGKHLSDHWKFMDTNEVAYSFSGHTHNHFTGFAYRDTGSIMKAFNNLPNESFFLGNEKAIITLPPVSGEKGRTGFTVFDTNLKQLSIINVIQSE